jgi:O-antigen ligase
MALAIVGLWGLFYGFTASGRPLDQSLGKTVRRHGEAWLLFFLFVFWVLMTSFWSPATELAAETVRRLATMAILGPIAIWAVHACAGQDRLLAQRAIVAGLFLALAILASEAVTHYAMTYVATPYKEPLEIAGDMGRGATAILTLFWVGFACLHQQMSDIRLRILLATLAIFVALQFGTDLNAVGLVAGTLAALLALRYPKAVLAAITGGTAVLVAAAPLIYPAIAELAHKALPGDAMPLSYGRRAQMWEIASGLILEKPLTGWGLGSGSTFDTPIQYGGVTWPIIQLHPHAAPLHIWLETGGIGALLAAMTIVAGGGVAIRLFGRYRVAAAALAGGLTFLSISWGFSHAAWREWVWVSFAALIAFSAMLRNPSHWQTVQRTRRGF